jgi:hypothetical protein
MAPDPYDVLFITDRKQNPERCVRGAAHHDSIDTRLGTNYGVFLPGTSQQGPLFRRETSALSVPYT